MVMVVVAFVSFSLFNFVGDPINNMVGEETSDEERAELRETLGLTELRNRQWSIQETSAIKNKGLFEGFDWLVTCIKGGEA